MPTAGGAPMRWRRKIQIGPRIGDIRIRKTLAWFPVKIGAFVVWLEFYYSVEKCWHVYGGFLKAKWGSEYLAFDLPSSALYLKSRHESYSYLKTKKWYRDSVRAEGHSPWYSDEKS
jgi:hypothetical protein